MRTSTIKRAAALGAAALIGATALAAAPAANAATGNNSLASVLGVGDKAGFDSVGTDYDVVTAAAEAVLGAKPDSAVGLLADGTVALTAFIPNDRAFEILATQLSGKTVTDEEAAFKVVAGLGIDTVETVLLYHVVPGKAIPAAAALKANAAKLQTAVDGKVIRVKVTSKPAIILGDYAPTLSNPRVILSQTNINKGNKQIAHGINRVLLPINPAA